MYSGGAWLPALGILFTLTGAVVCALLYMRRGWYPVIFERCIGRCCGVCTDAQCSCGHCVMIGVAAPGCAMMAVWKKRLGMREIITAGTMGFLVQTMLEFIIIRLKSGENIFSEMFSSMQMEIDAMLPQFREMLEASGAANVEESMQALTQIYHYLLETLAQLIPAILFICSCVMAYLVLCICTAFLRRSGQDTGKITPFTELHAPRSVALAVLVTFAISLFAPTQVIRGAALNITVVLFAYFAVCGISLLCFWMKRLFPRILLRTLIAIPMVAVLLSMMMLPILNPVQLFWLAGILDSAFRFRRRAGCSDVM